MLNNFVAMGRLVKDVEYKETEKAKVSSFSLAFDNSRKDAEGNYKTSFIDCVTFGATAEFVKNFFGKGDSIIITGELEQDKYQDKAGNNRYSYKVNVSNVSFVGKKESTEKDNPEEGQVAKFDPYTGKPLKNK